MDKQIFLNGISVEDFESRLIEKLKTELAKGEPEPGMKSTDDFLTVKQVSKLLGVSLVTVHKWKKDGKLKFHRFGTRIRFLKSEILGNEKFCKTGKQC